MAQELFICVLNRPELLDDIMAGFIEIGVVGSTIIDSKGMGKVISQDIPIFAGFKGMFSGARESNVTILSVMEGSMIDEAMAIIEEISPSFTEEASGIMFSLPINRVKGFTKNGG